MRRAEKAEHSWTEHPISGSDTPADVLCATTELGHASVV